MNRATIILLLMFLTGCITTTEHQGVLPTPREPEGTVGLGRRKIVDLILQAELAKPLKLPNIVSKDAMSTEFRVSDKSADAERTGFDQRKLSVMKYKDAVMVQDREVEKKTLELLRSRKMGQILPIALRGAERCIIAIGAIFLVYLGYKLFVIGKDRGRGELRAKAKFVEFGLCGSGPGLFFMALGAFVLLAGLFSGKVHTKGTAEHITRKVPMTPTPIISLSTDNEAPKAPTERDTSPLLFPRDPNTVEVFYRYVDDLRIGAGPPLQIDPNSIKYLAPLRWPKRIEFRELIKDSKEAGKEQEVNRI